MGFSYIAFWFLSRITAIYVAERRVFLGNTIDGAIIFIFLLPFIGEVVMAISAVLLVIGSTMATSYRYLKQAFTKVE